MTYKIIRFYYRGSKRVIKRGLTLALAQEHCHDPRTKRDGVFFDGYEQER